MRSHRLIMTSFNINIQIILSDLLNFCKFFSCFDYISFCGIIFIYKWALEGIVDSMYKYVKRVMDFVFSLIFIVLFSPIIIIVLLITFFDIGRPLIDIRIPREGFDKKPFYMYKIRTRVYDENGNSTYTKMSKRIDKLGLNELVQLFNILKGEMSFIGPRPFICGEILPKGKISPKRYMVKPGVMSLAQAKGGRFLSYEETLRCDEEYYDNFGFKQDFIIFFKSIKTVIKNNFL